MADRIVKNCTKCGETKPLDDFHKRKEAKDGHRTECKACYAARSKAHYEQNRERILDDQRRYQEANKDRRAEYHRQYYQANKDRVIEAVRGWREDNPERVAELKQRWAEENPEKVAAARRAYYESNRQQVIDRAVVGGYRARAVKHGHEPVVEDFTKADVIERYGDSCFYCEAGAFEHLDHYVSVKAGGPHTLDNLRPSCAPCNLAKSDLHPDEWLAEQAELDALTGDEFEAAIDAEIARWTD